MKLGRGLVRSWSAPVANADGGAAETARNSPDEAEAKSLLAEAGLPVPPGRRAANAGDATAAAAALGFPVALKALGIAHKSEHGAVRLNLSDEASVRDAANALSGLGTGLYVERMVTGGIAELIVGVTRDPIFGPVMTIGSGGVLVELLKDSATLLLPATLADIEAALRGLKLFPLLDGYRGRPKADIVAAIDAISAIAAFAASNAGAIEELDINPLIVCAEGYGAWIADALLVQSEAAAIPSPLWGGRRAGPGGGGPEPSTSSPPPPASRSLSSGLPEARPGGSAPSP